MATRGKRYFSPHLVFTATRRSFATTESESADAGIAGEAARLTCDQADRFREAILPLMNSAYNLACYLARDPVAAEDIVQEAYLRAFRAFHTYRGEAAKPWLLAIVRNCFLNWVKADRAGRGDLEKQGDPADGAHRSMTDLDGVDHDDPEVMLLRRREVETVRAALEGLPEPFRETLALRELEGLSYKEIAMLAAVPIGTVMSRLARGRRMLAERLRPSVTSARETSP